MHWFGYDLGSMTAGPVVTAIFVGGSKHIIHDGQKVFTGIFKSSVGSTSR
jgi:hypothetical protein